MSALPTLREVAASLVRESKYLNATSGPYGLDVITESEWLDLLAQSNVPDIIERLREASAPRHHLMSGGYCPICGGSCLIGFGSS